MKIYTTVEPSAGGPNLHALTSKKDADRRTGEEASGEKYLGAFNVQGIKRDSDSVYCVVELQGDDVTGIEGAYAEQHAAQRAVGNDGNRLHVMPVTIERPTRRQAAGGRRSAAGVTGGRITKRKKLI